MRFVAVLVLLLSALPVWAGKTALVLGNGTYVHADPLRNAANDARDIASRLRGLGFVVFEGIDLGRTDTLRLVQDFSRSVAFDDTALFYFAGHGMQLGSDNYILPVDAQPGTETELTQSAIRLQTILKTMESNADTRIIILDACRNNPFLRNRSTRGNGQSRGLMKMEAGVGSFIAFSTEPGNVAADGNGRNSPFTDALLRHISTPGADIHAVMRAVRSDVMTASNQTQVPWENSALIEQVFLAPQPRTPAAEPKIAATVPAPPAVAFLAPTTPAPAPAAPAARAFAPTTPMTFDHFVGGLDPNGDGFLALRSGTTSQAHRLAKMPAGTPLQVHAQSGVWWQVSTLGGQTGWAHSRWILCCRTQTRQDPIATTQTLDCNGLWRARNAIFAARGYCFQSQRGINAFGNNGCIPGMRAADVPLSSAERAEISRLQNLEQAQGCR